MYLFVLIIFQGAPMRPEMQEQLSEKLKTLQEYMKCLEKDVDREKAERASLQEHLEKQLAENSRLAEELAAQKMRSDHMHKEQLKTQELGNREIADERQRLKEALLLLEQEKGKVEKKAAKVPALKQV